MSRDPLFQSDVPGEAAARRPDDPIRPRIGVWGRFGTADFAELAQPAILEREIRRRLPEAELRTYAVRDSAGETVFAVGPATSDLGRWSDRRATELSESLDFVVVAGDLFGVSEEIAGSASPGPRLSSFLVEGLGGELEAACPVAWSAVSLAFDPEPEEAKRLRDAVAGRPYVSVRDEASRLRLRAAGIESEIALVPDPLLLLPRAFPEEVLARRLEYLKHMEWFPRGDAPLVIQAAAFGDRVEEMAATVATALERSPLPVVLLGLGPGSGDGRFADALSQRSAAPIFRFPADPDVGDTAATLAHARAFLGGSARASVACSAFGVPALVLDRPGGSRRERVLAIRQLLQTPAGAGADPAQTAALDAHFDRLAGLAEGALVGRLRRQGVSEEKLLARLRENERVLESWRAAHAARSQQVVDARLRAADLTERLEKLAAQAKEFEDEAARRHHAWAGVTFDLAAERAQRENTSRVLAAEREISARMLAEREELRSRLSRLEQDLAESQTRSSELETELEITVAESSRRQKREAGEIVGLGAELERIRERLERARSDHAELRASHTHLFTEVAEARADAGRSADLVRELSEELERLRLLLSAAKGVEEK
jgi:polysaccharide pyruvyl transferase